MNRVWRYVLATDNGMAPCAENHALSLCLCKPTIRAHARVGDWVVGFVPKRIKVGHVDWAGRVAAVIPMGDYERAFSGRSDAIHRQEAGPRGEPDILVPVRDDYHCETGSRSRYIGGKNCLVFDPFWYWGGTGIPVPQQIAELAHYYVGVSTKNSSPAMIATLEEWLLSQPTGIHGQPRDRTQVQRHRSCA